MRHLITLSAIATLALVASSAQAQTVGASSSSPARQIIQQLMGAKGASITPTYKDAKGHAITEQAFNAAVKQGRTFSVDHGGDNFQFTLLAPGAKAGSDAKAAASSLKVGQALPGFQLPLVQGGQAHAAALDGRPTLVDFFFADCIGCIEELPALNAYMAKHPDMHFLAITFDDAKTAKAFVEQRHFAWPVAYDGKPVFKQLEIHAAPTMLLLDAKGRFLASHTGSIPVSVNASAKQAPSTPSASDTKTVQLKWLSHWVDQQTRRAPR